MTADHAMRASRRECIGLAVLALPCMLYAMDLTVLNLAVPALSRDLAPSSSQLLWIIDIYGFLVAGSLITMGTLGDRIGRRRLLLIGAMAFGLVSVLAAFAKSAEMLIAARALLGLAGATVAPSTLSLIRNMFHDPHQRAVAIGVWITSYSVGAAVGPFVGGLLLERFWWGSVFLVGVPVMLLLLVLGPVLLPEFRDPQAGRLDLASAAMSLVAVLLVILGLKRTAQDGFGWLPGFAVVGGAAIGLGFVRRQRALPYPLIDLRLFRSPVFTASLTTYMLATFVAFGVYVFTAQYLQLVLGLSPFVAGLWTLPGMGAFIVGSNLTAVLARRFRPLPVMLGEFGGALGIAILGSIGTAIYRTQLAAVAPAGIPTAAMDAARSTLGGAVAAAERLPDAAAFALLGPARDAFTRTLQLNAAVSCAVVVGTAVAAAVLLRRAGGSTQHTGTPADLGSDGAIAGSSRSE